MSQSSRIKTSVASLHYSVRNTNSLSPLEWWICKKESSEWSQFICSYKCFSENAYSVTATATIRWHTFWSSIPTTHTSITATTSIVRMRGIGFQGLKSGSRISLRSPNGLSTASQKCTFRTIKMTACTGILSATQKVSVVLAEKGLRRLGQKQIRQQGARRKRIEDTDMTAWIYSTATGTGRRRWKCVR